MALAFRKPAPPIRVPVHPVDWTPPLLRDALTGLNPRRAADREQARGLQRALGVAIRQDLRRPRETFDLAAVLEAPRGSLPLQVVVYRELYDYLAIWLEID